MAVVSSQFPRAPALRSTIDSLRELRNSRSAVVFKIPEIILIASYCEALLNDNLIAFAYGKWGDEYRDVCDRYIRMSPMDKLTVLVPMMTGGRFLLILNNELVRNIRELFERRNQIVHAKSYVKEFNVETFQHLVSGEISNPTGLDGAHFMLEACGSDAELTEFLYSVDRLDRWFFRRCRRGQALDHVRILSEAKPRQRDPISWYTKEIS